MAVSPTSVEISSHINKDSLSIIKCTPPVPALALACKLAYNEVRSIYYEENRFHFTKDGLRKRALEEFRRRAGRFADKITAITITRSFRCKTTMGLLEFTVKHQNGEIVIKDLTSSYYRRPLNPLIPAREQPAGKLCSCNVYNLARGKRKPVLEFVEEYFEGDGTWKYGEVRVAIFGPCQSCERHRVYSRAW